MRNMNPLSTFMPCEATTGKEGGVCLPSPVCSFYGGRAVDGDCNMASSCCISELFSTLFFFFNIITGANVSHYDRWGRKMRCPSYAQQHVLASSRGRQFGKQLRVNCQVGREFGRTKKGHLSNTVQLTHDIVIMNHTNYTGHFYLVLFRTVLISSPS